VLKSDATKERIRSAARAAFGARGFDATTVRAIATDADVDPALVLHYFGSKAELFVAALELPIDPAPLFEAAAAQPEGAGRAVAAAVLAALDHEGLRPYLLGILRSAASDDKAAAMLREVITERVVGPAVRALDVDHPDLRATLVGSQIVGLAFARHVVGVGPLVETPSDQLADAIGPALQHYLTGDLS